MAEKTAFITLFYILCTLEYEEPKNPCVPSPCGQYSICRVSNTRAVCSCQPNYYGAPPNCRPECMVNSDWTMIYNTTDCIVTTCTSTWINTFLVAA